MAGPVGIRSRESGHLSARHKTQRFESDEILYGKRGVLPISGAIPPLPFFAKSNLNFTC